MKFILKNLIIYFVKFHFSKEKIFKDVFSRKYSIEQSHTKNVNFLTHLAKA
jgi:hypothetical protein